MTATVFTLISFYIINYVALYIIKKVINYKTIPKKNKKKFKIKFRTINRDRFCKFNNRFNKRLN